MAAPTFVADELVTATKMNSLPKGWIGYAERTTGQGSITTITDLTGLSVAVTVAAGRRIKVTGKILAKSSVATDLVVGTIREGSTVLQRFANHASGALYTSSQGSILLSPTAGSHTYKLSLERGTGTGTIDHAADPTFPAFILVEDLGSV